MVVKTTNPEAVAAATSVAAQHRPHLLNETISTVVDPHLARQMLHRALESVPTAWVVGDEVYGRNPGLRTYLEQHRTG